MLQFSDTDDEPPAYNAGVILARNQVVDLCTGWINALEKPASGLCRPSSGLGSERDRDINRAC